MQFLEILNYIQLYYFFTPGGKDFQG